MLGSNRGLVLDEASARARLAELSGTLGVQLDPDSRAGSLALGQQQQVEIIKALWKGSRVLILDEPTSMLTPQGIAELEKVLVGLKASGLAIIFITHKLHEAIGHRRPRRRAQGRAGSSGRLEPEVLRTSTPEQLQRMIVGLMFGEQEEPAASIAELREEIEEIGVVHVRRALSDEPWLELVDATAGGDELQPGITGVSLAVRGGEILGVGGMDGNGQRALAEVDRRAAARRSRDESASMGADVERLSVSERQRRGLRYVTDDRLGEGVVAPYAVGLNLFLKRIGEAPFWRRGAVDRPRIDAAARSLIEEFDIRTPSERTTHRQAQRRQHPEGDPGSRAVVRASRRRLQQAHPRPRRPDDRLGPRAHP